VFELDLSLRGDPETSPCNPREIYSEIVAESEFAAQISASIEDFVVSFCFSEEEEKDPFPREVADADWLRPSWWTPYEASEWLLIVMFVESDAFRVSPSNFVLLKYLRTRRSISLPFEVILWTRVVK
jgi:hypothetical protein